MHAAGTAARSVSLQALVEAPPSTGRSRGGALPQALHDGYGGDLSIRLRPDRPTLVANFVSTLDGVVSYATPEAAGGGEVSGFFDPDRLVMGLLRALADVVLVGAGTVRADPRGAWTPDGVHPGSSDDFVALRRGLGLRSHPITAVVTGAGALDLQHPGLADPTVDVVLITTDAGAAALHRQRVPSHVQVHSAGDRIRGHDVINALAIRGAELVLCEGGPHLFGQLLGDDLVDELFLTLAPQLVGRSAASPRLSLVEDIAFDLAGSRWSRLADLRRAGDHLFARYVFTERMD